MDALDAEAGMNLNATEIIDLLGGPAAVARLLKIRTPSVSEWKRAGIPVDKMVLLAVPLERATGNKFRRWHARPDDWYRIWPELIGLRGAPRVPKST